MSDIDNAIIVLLAWGGGPVGCYARDQPRLIITLGIVEGGNQRALRITEHDPMLIVAGYQISSFRQMQTETVCRIDNRGIANQVGDLAIAPVLQALNKLNEGGVS